MYKKKYRLFKIGFLQRTNLFCKIRTNYKNRYPVKNNPFLHCSMLQFCKFGLHHDALV